MKQDIGLKKAKAVKADKRDAYSVLHKDIIELRLKPGTIVSIRNLCEHYQISRSPMRDALIRLSQEGQTNLLPQRGIMISKIDLKRVEEERFLRLSVEENVLQMYLTCRKADDIASIEALIEKQRHSIQAQDLREYMEQDNAFHQFFYRATGKQFCADVIWKASSHYSRVRLLASVDRVITDKETRQHTEMLEAIRENNAQKLIDIFKVHLSDLDSETHALRQKYPDLFLNASFEEKQIDELRSDFLDKLKD